MWLLLSFVSGSVMTRVHTGSMSSKQVAVKDRPCLQPPCIPVQMMGAVVKRYFAQLINKKPEDICLVRWVDVAPVAGVHNAMRWPACSNLSRTLSQHLHAALFCQRTQTPGCLQVSVMPCTAKKYEAERGEMRRDGEGPDIGGCTRGQPAGSTCLGPCMGTQYCVVSQVHAISIPQKGPFAPAIFLRHVFTQAVSVCFPFCLDYVITTREFGRLLRWAGCSDATAQLLTHQGNISTATRAGADYSGFLLPLCRRERRIPLASLPESPFDNPLVGDSGLKRHPWALGWAFAVGLTGLCTAKSSLSPAVHGHAASTQASSRAASCAERCLHSLPACTGREHGRRRHFWQHGWSDGGCAAHCLRAGHRWVGGWNTVVERPSNHSLSDLGLWDSLWTCAALLCQQLCPMPLPCRPGAAAPQGGGHPRPDGACRAGWEAGCGAVCSPRCHAGAPAATWPTRFQCLPHPACTPPTGHQGGHAAPARLRAKRLCGPRAARGGGLGCAASHPLHLLWMPEQPGDLVCARLQLCLQLSKSRTARDPGCPATQASATRATCCSACTRAPRRATTLWRCAGVGGSV